MSSVHTVVIDSMQLGEVLENHLRAIFKRDPDVVPLVSRLLAGSRPLAVAWLVVAVVVHSFKTVAFWLLAHISKEVCEVFPSLAHLDSTTAIARKSVNTRIFTAVNHASPERVFAGYSADTAAMAQLNLADLFGECAAAALRVTGAQFLRLYGRFLAAVTTTNPRRVIELVARATLDGHQSSKALSGNFNGFHGVELYQETT